jgi:putative oxidoreductase
MKPYVELLGRILISTIFILTGFSKLTGYAGTSKMLAGIGIPLASVAAALAILIELGGGLLLVAGWQTRCVATVMFFYLIVITLKLHNFWNAPPAMHQDQYIHFLKNVAIMGGMLKLAADGAGAISMDRRTRHT